MINTLDTVTISMGISGPRRRPCFRRGWALIWFAMGCLLQAGAGPIEDLTFKHLGIKDGLPHPAVFSITQDPHGFLWFGTQAGLVRYDGYHLEVFKPDPAKANGMSYENAGNLFCDRDGILWIGTWGGGLMRMDTRTYQFTSFRHDPEDPNSISSNRVQSFYQCSDGAILIGTFADGLNVWQPQTQSFINYRHDENNPDSPNNNRVWNFIEDPQGNVWIGTDLGVEIWSKQDRQAGITRFRNHAFPQANPEKVSLDVSRCFEVVDQQVWQGSLAGIHVMDKQLNPVRSYRNRNQPPWAISNDSISKIYKDSMGSVWVGSFNGLNRKPADQVRFETIQNGFNGFVGNDVRWIFEDRDHILWVATRDGGINYTDLKQKMFTLVKPEPGKLNTLSNGGVTGFAVDRNQTLWVATYGGLNKETAPGEFKSFRRTRGDPTTLSGDRLLALVAEEDHLWVGSDNGLDYFDIPSEKVRRVVFAGVDSQTVTRVSSLQLDQKGTLWVGSWMYSLLYLDRDDFSLKSFKTKDFPNPLKDHSVNAMHETRDGRLWVGTSVGGLSGFDKERSQLLVRFSPDSPQKLTSENVLSIHEDDNGFLWVGTTQGLDQINLNTLDVAAVYGERFQDQTVYAIETDATGCIWAATNLGLSKLDPIADEVINYNPGDGLQGHKFLKASLKMDDGALLFGGVSGYNTIYPETVNTTLKSAPVMLTQIEVLGEDVAFLAPEKTRSLTLAYNQRFFRSSFSTLDFTNPEEIRYAWRLDPISDNWLEMKEKNHLTFSNLVPGSYTLRVKSRSGGAESGGAAELPIVIQPPWYLSPAAFLTYAVLLVLILYWLFHLQQRKLKREKHITQQLRKLDKLKDEFLANTSHELRTPLHGMIGLAESLLHGASGDLPQKARSDLGMIVHSGKRLANLVNDILDFSKLKNRELQLDFRSLDPRTAVDIVFQIVSPLLVDKNVVIRNEVPANLPAVWADEDRLQQILINLTGNAIKFTLEGEIRITAEQDGDWVWLRVHDTGIGIEESHLEDIFQLFEQLSGEAQRSFSGTGLGLAVTKRLVELHGGMVTVTSKPDEGSVFSFNMPVSSQAAAASSPDTALPTRFFSTQEQTHTPEVLLDHADTGHSFNILVVDDESINRQVLINYLAFKRFTIIEAPDGPSAIKIIEAGEPKIDLVLLDVMMPKMSGFEVCTWIRSRFPHQEMPIIFITAKNQIEDLVGGFTSGGNDYLVKPFAKEEIILRVETHIALLEASRVLEDANRVLEAKVEARTQALLSQNEDLEAVNHRLKRAQQELYLTAHKAGMAEIATQVLHCIGNAVNTTKTSTEFLGEAMGDDSILNFLQRINRLLEEHQEELALFIAEDPKGKQIPIALKTIAEMMSKKDTTYRRELNTLAQSISEIEQILQAQQRMTEFVGEKESIHIEDLVTEVTNIKRLRCRNLNIDLEVDLNCPGVVQTEKHKLMQVLFRLLDNAVDALEAHQSEDKAIQITGAREGANYCIHIRDNGPGIDPSMAIKIFNQGFSTKADRLGLGLHYCANAMTELDGKLELVESEAPWRTSFQLTL